MWWPRLPSDLYTAVVRRLSKLVSFRISSRVSWGPLVCTGTAPRQPGASLGGCSAACTLAAAEARRGAQAGGPAARRAGRAPPHGAWLPRQRPPWPPGCRRPSLLAWPPPQLLAQGPPAAVPATGRCRRALRPSACRQALRRLQRSMHCACWRQLASGTPACGRRTGGRGVAACPPGQTPHTLQGGVLGGQRCSLGGRCRQRLGRRGRSWHRWRGRRRGHRGWGRQSGGGAALCDAAPPPRAACSDSSGGPPSRARTGT